MALTSAPEQRDTLSLREFSERTGKPMATIYQMIAERRFPLPVLKIGHTYHISRRVYEAWLAGDDETDD